MNELNTPTPKVSRNPRTAIRRDTILQAARSVFARQGYAAAMVEDIAAEAGVGKGTVYLYFDSKQSIYWEIVLQDCNNLADATKKALASPELTWLERIERFIRVRLEYCEQHPAFLRILLTEVYAMILQNRPVDPRLSMMVQQAEFQLSQIFAVAMAKGEIKTIDPMIPATTVMALTRGMLELSLKGASRSEVDNQLQFTLELLRNSLSITRN